MTRGSMRQGGASAPSELWIVDPPGSGHNRTAPRMTFLTEAEANKYAEGCPAHTRIYAVTPRDGVETRPWLTATEASEVAERTTYANYNETDGGAVPSREAADFCLEAAELVAGPRQASHGDKSINFRNIADMWNALLVIKWRKDGSDVHNPPQCLDAGDVGDFMEAFKIARRHSGSYNPDDYIDAAGYAGCTGSIRQSE